MSTKINTLELYVKGVQAYPNNMQKTELESVLGFWPEDLDDSTILADRLKSRPTNCLNYEILHDYHMHDSVADTGWYDYWNVGTDRIPADTLIYWPEFTSAQLSSLTEKYDLGGPNCIEYPNVIDLSKGVVDLHAPADNYTYEWHYNWGSNGGVVDVLENFGHTLGLNGNRCKVLRFNNQQIPHYYNEASSVLTDNIGSEYRWMFYNCKNLERIEGLNLSGFSMEHSNQWGWPFDTTAELEGLEKYFMNCKNLTTFTNVTWPRYANYYPGFSGPCYAYMFYNCRSLPDNQFPTMNFVGTGHVFVWDDTQQTDVLTTLKINCEYIYYGCEKMTTQHIPTSYLSNVDNLTGAFAYSGITSLEIPTGLDSTSKLPYMIQGCKDLTQLIIRSTDLYGDKSQHWDVHIYGKDGLAYSSLLSNILFNPNDVNLLNENLAIYVPDAELQEWINMHATTGVTETDQRITDIFHGLSELSE